MPEDIKQIFLRAYAERDPWVHKGDFGYVLVITGSEKYSGSSVFNGIAALRAGADLVVLRGHLRAMNIAATFAPDIITEPFVGEFSESDVANVERDMGKYDALVIGCGMERSERSFAAIRALVTQSTIPMVLDAEAIRAVAGHADILRGKQAILTPNSEEFKILCGEDPGVHESERKEKAAKCARELGVTILLKGHVDVISDGEQTAVNTTGSPMMTKGGFGDMLAGIAGALLARGVDPFNSARIAAYINGRAGERASEKHGEGVLASDALNEISAVLCALKE